MRIIATKLIAALAAFIFSTFATAQYSGDVRLSRVGVMTPASSQGVLYGSVTGGGILKGSGSAADVSLMDRSSNVLLSIGAGAYTNNASTWTYGNNYTATRAAGVLATGTQTLATNAHTFSGDAGGATSPRGFVTTLTGSGANALNTMQGLVSIVDWAGTNTVTIGRTFNNSLTLSSTGNITTVQNNLSGITLSSSGSVTTANMYRVNAPTLSSTGAVTTLNGFSSGNLGHASLVTNAIGHDTDDMTAALTLTAGFRSQISAGTGKFGFIASGTATNSVNGPLLNIGTTALAPASTQSTQYVSAANGGIYRGSGSTYDVSLVSSAGTTVVGAGGANLTKLTFPVLTAASGTPNSVCINSATKEITENAALTCTVSSNRFKDSISDFTLNGTQIVAALKPTTFYYKDRLTRSRIGLIAEDLAAVDPRLAEWDEQNRPHSIDFSALMAVMIKTIQEQQARIEALEAR